MYYVAYLDKRTLHGGGGGGLCGPSPCFTPFFLGRTLFVAFVSKKNIETFHNCPKEIHSSFQMEIPLVHWSRLQKHGVIIQSHRCI